MLIVFFEWLLHRKRLFLKDSLLWSSFIAAVAILIILIFEAILMNSYLFTAVIIKFFRTAIDVLNNFFLNFWFVYIYFGSFTFLTSLYFKLHLFLFSTIIFTIIKIVFPQLLLLLFILWIIFFFLFLFFFFFLLL